MVLLLSHTAAALKGHQGPKQDTPSTAWSSPDWCVEPSVQHQVGIGLDAQRRFWENKQPPTPVGAVPELQNSCDGRRTTYGGHGVWPDSAGAASGDRARQLAIQRCTVQSLLQQPLLHAGRSAQADQAAVGWYKTLSAQPADTNRPLATRGPCMVTAFHRDCAGSTAWVRQQI